MFQPFVQSGIQFFHPLQPECMDIAKIKREYGRHIAFRGGIGVQNAVSFGTPDEARKQVREAGRILCQGGGYLMETVKPLFANVPLENALAVIDEIRKVSRYEF